MFYEGRLALRAQLGAARAGLARATNLGLPNKRAQRRLTDRRARARARLRAREGNPIRGHALDAVEGAVRLFFCLADGALVVE